MLVFCQTVRQPYAQLTLLTLRRGQSSLAAYLWLPGNWDIPSNCKADELARQSTTRERQSLHNDYGISIATLKLKFEEESIKEANLTWWNTYVCRQLTLIWPSTNKKITLTLLSLKRNNIFISIGVLTGHWLFTKHGNKLFIITSQSCRSCGFNDDVETTEHCLCSCPALASLRLKTLGNCFFDSPIKLSNPFIKDLMCFINATKWFTRTDST